MLYKGLATLWRIMSRWDCVCEMISIIALYSKSDEQPLRGMTWYPRQTDGVNSWGPEGQTRPEYAIQTNLACALTEA
jgi:hypothetical protein